MKVEIYTILMLAANIVVSLLLINISNNLLDVITAQVFYYLMWLPCIGRVLRWW